MQVKDTYINGSLHYLDFRCVYVCVCVCVCVCSVCGGRRGQKYLYLPWPPMRDNTVPYLPKTYEKPWPGGSLKFSFWMYLQ